MGRWLGGILGEKWLFMVHLPVINFLKIINLLFIAESVGLYIFKYTVTNRNLIWTV